MSAKHVLEGVRTGDSIAVNGVCLTVTQYGDSTFTVDVMPETYRRTTLNQLRPGDSLNLERAMLIGSRFGGHIVQGHIDGTGVIRKREQQDNAVYFTIEPTRMNLLQYIVPKGSIAVDGISLTVVDTSERDFRVSIIPHTLAATVLYAKNTSEQVNLETDIIGKYVERLVSMFQSHKKMGTLTEHFLKDNGFM